MAENHHNVVHVCFPHALLLLDRERLHVLRGSSTVESDCQDFRETPMGGRGGSNLAGVEDLSPIS